MPLASGAKPTVCQLLGDLRDEGFALDRLVGGLGSGDWHLPTPAPGWTVAHQIAHLWWTDETMTLSARATAGSTDAIKDFSRLVERAGSGPSAATAVVDEAATERAALAHSELLVRWRQCRNELVDVLGALPPGARLAWFGPQMSVASAATARLMETWAHGQDIADALGASRPPTARLRHIAHLGVRTRDFSFRINGRPAPVQEFRVELQGPDGAEWAWGPADAEQRVTGPALDFCLLVTQRAALDTLRIASAGPDAALWLSLAQAFAGPPGDRRRDPLVQRIVQRKETP